MKNYCTASFSLRAKSEEIAGVLISRSGCVLADVHVSLRIFSYHPTYSYRAWLV